MTRRNSFFWLVILAVGVYAALSTRFYVGYFGDDARDILAAQSILHGSYSDLQQPGHPPLNLPLPGFSLLLAPFVALFGSALGFLRIIPILGTIGSLIFLRRLFEPYFKTRTALLTCLGLFAFNPATLAYSTLVIADTSYLFFMAWALVLVHQDQQSETFKTNGLLTLVLAGIVLLRPEGGLLVMAVFILRVQERRWKAAAASAVLPAMSLGLWLLRNVRATGQFSGYSPLWGEAFSFLRAGYPSWFSYLREWSQKLFLDLLLGISMQLSTVFRAALGMGLIFVVILMLARGCRKVMSFTKTPPAWLLVMIIYVYAHVLLHAVWPAADPHYLWPLLPFLLFFLVQGSPKSVWIFLGALYLWQGGYALSATFQKHPDQELPKETIDWISSRTSQDSYFLAPNASVITLYTGRHALALIRARGQDDFFAQLHHTGITHILVLPPRFLYLQQASGPSPEKAWWRIGLTAAHAPDHYEQIYENPSEESLVYRVKN